jgi:hypothetical protein
MLTEMTLSAPAHCGERVLEHGKRESYLVAITQKRLLFKTNIGGRFVALTLDDSAVG